MSHADLQATIEAAFDDRDNVGINNQGEIREAVNDALAAFEDVPGADLIRAM